MPSSSPPAAAPAGQGDNYYLYDTTNPTSVSNTTLITHTPGNPMVSANAPADAFTATTAPSASVSDNGQDVAFYSAATNLTSTATSAGYNAFLFNATTDNVTLITHQSIPSADFPAQSIPTTGLPATTLPPITYPPLTTAISGDGLYVAYVGFAAADISGLTNVNTLPGSKGMDALLYNTSTGAYTLLSHAFASATTTSTSEAYTPVFSDNDSTVLYLDDGNNLLPATVNGHTGQDLDAALPIDGTDMYAYNLTTPSGYTPVAGNADTAAAPLGSNSTVTLRDPNLPSLTGNGMSEISPIDAVSDNGNYAVYFSNAPDLVANEIDTTPTTLTLNVYLYNRSAGTTTLVSKAAGTTATTGNGESTNAVISGDGSTVLFYSYATNLLTSETWAGTAGSDAELYMYNVSTGVLSLVSHTPGNASQAANGTVPLSPGYPPTTLLYDNATAQGLPLPSVSDNGQYIAYLSNASDLTGSGGSSLNGTITNVTDPFLGTVTITTASTAGLTTGTSVTLAGLAGNLAVYDGAYNITVTSSTTFTLPTGTAPGLGYTYSGGGTWTVGGGTPTNAFLYDRAADTNTVVSQLGSTAANGNASTVAISSDGSTVAFTDNATNLLSTAITTSGDQLYVWSRINNVGVTGLTAGQIQLASHAIGSTTTAASFSSGTATSLWGPLPASLSANGAFVAYYFGGNNLVTGQSGTAKATNVFRYDVLNNVNALVTHTNTSATTAGDNPTNSNLYEASGPAISANGQYIAYANNSTNLLGTALTGQNGQDNVYLYNASAAVGGKIRWSATPRVQRQRRTPMAVRRPVSLPMAPAAITSVSWIWPCPTTSPRSS